MCVSGHAGAGLPQLVIFRMGKRHHSNMGDFFLGCAGKFEVFLSLLISILKKLDEHHCSCSAAVVLWLSHFTEVKYTATYQAL